MESETSPLKICKSCRFSEETRNRGQRLNCCCPRQPDFDFIAGIEDWPSAIGMWHEECQQGEWWKPRVQGLDTHRPLKADRTDLEWLHVSTCASCRFLEIREYDSGRIGKVCMCPQQDDFTENLNRDSWYRIDDIRKDQCKGKWWQSRSNSKYAVTRGQTWWRMIRNWFSRILE